MDILELINTNVFLKRLFPNGLTEPVYIGQIGFDVEGRMSVNIHTKQKTAIEVSKWGNWGVDYNVIVIKLNGLCRDSASLKNWKNAGYEKLTIDKNIETFIISQQGSNWSIELECDALIFNECSIYTDEAE
ncbi:hypothetical protein ACIQYL_09690 [Lysinibacillus xylanilyticus]|uniref:hypothetical protein n=1 Tax=Lysinibacillus xylanilyticus TaxID=582475 RepID=UPI00380FF592